MRLLFALSIVFYILTGCAGPYNTNVNGARIKLDESGPQPKWVRDASDTWEDKHRIYFKSFLMDQTDVSMGLDAAKAKGIKEVAERVSMKISTDLGYTERGSSSNRSAATRFLTSSVAAQTEQMQLSGFKTEESYWVRYQVMSETRAEYIYDIYRSFSVSRSDYNDAKQAVLDRARGLAVAAMDKKAEQEVEELLKRNQIKEGP